MLTLRHILAGHVETITTFVWTGEPWLDRGEGLKQAGTSILVKATSDADA